MLMLFALTQVRIPSNATFVDVVIKINAKLNKLHSTIKTKLYKVRKKAVIEIVAPVGVEPATAWRCVEH